MATGTVKFFAQDKGFGFITPDDGGQLRRCIEGWAKGPLRDGPRPQDREIQGGKRLCDLMHAEDLRATVDEVARRSSSGTEPIKYGTEVAYSCSLI